MNDKYIITNVSCDEAEAQRKANDYARRVFGDSVVSVSRTNLPAKAAARAPGEFIFEFEVKVRS